MISAIANIRLDGKKKLSADNFFHFSINARKKYMCNILGYSALKLIGGYKYSHGCFFNLSQDIT